MTCMIGKCSISYRDLTMININFMARPPYVTMKRKRENTMIAIMKSFRISELS